jgi:hypothetical protein
MNSLSLLSALKGATSMAFLVWPFINFRIRFCAKLSSFLRFGLTKIIERKAMSGIPISIAMKKNHLLVRGFIYKLYAPSEFFQLSV